MFNKQKAIDFVKEQMKSQGSYSKNRFNRIIRVQKYANTLCNFVDKVDTDIVEAAALFHNIGFSDNEESAIKTSCHIAKEYLKKDGFDNEFINRVCQAINNYDLLIDDDVISKISMEDKILIDANMIEKSGVLKVFDIILMNKHDENYEVYFAKLKEEVNTIEQYIKNAHTKRGKELLIKNYLLLKGLIHTIEAEIKGEYI